MFYTDVKLFKDQGESDAVLDDVACMVGCTRSCLNVVASDKGLVVGRVSFLEDGMCHVPFLLRLFPWFVVLVFVVVPCGGCGVVSFLHLHCNTCVMLPSFMNIALSNRVSMFYSPSPAPPRHCRRLDRLHTHGCGWQGYPSVHRQDL